MTELKNNFSNLISFYSNTILPQSISKFIPISFIKDKVKDLYTNISNIKNHIDIIDILFEHFFEYLSIGNDLILENKESVINDEIINNLITAYKLDGGILPSKSKNDIRDEGIIELLNKFDIEDGVNKDGDKFTFGIRREQLWTLIPKQNLRCDDEYICVIISRTYKGDKYKILGLYFDTIILEEVPEKWSMIYKILPLFNL